MWQFVKDNAGMSEARKNYSLYSIIVAFILVILFFYPSLPIKDKQSFFNFADKRFIFGVANGMDVISNLAFFIFGVMGLRNAFKSSLSKVAFYQCLLYSTAIILTCFGSSYFHLNPNPDTLVWDRLPMTMGFSAVIGMTLSERVNEKLGLITTLILIPTGFFTIFGHKFGLITLRPYIVLQFGCLAFIALMMLLSTDKRGTNTFYWSALGFYVLAKIFEVYDHQIFFFSGYFVSGHTLKHLAAAIATWRLSLLFKN